MEKENYIKFIRLKLNGTSGINFQTLVGKILSTYYQNIGKTYEMYSAFGGDDKNDGWVKEDALFYQIYSPYNYPSSFVSDVRSKFKEDLTKLYDLVYNQHKWNNKISTFIFIVNTRDDNLPLNSDGYYESVVESLNNKYETDVKFQVVNSDYFYNLLFQLDESVLFLICSKLEISGLISLDFTTAKDLLDFIEITNNYINEDYLYGNFKDYKRISSDKKININKLQNKKERINLLITKCSIVEQVLSHYNNNIHELKKFNNIKDLYIEQYNTLSKIYSGEKLYDELLRSILSLTPSLEMYSLPAEIIMVYIFDKCDIFEKEI